MSAPVLRADGSSFERVLDALGDYVTRVRSHGRHADARCPAHDDNNPSLSIDWKNNPAKGGVTVLKCHAAGCDARDVLAAVGLSLSDTYDTEPYSGRRAARLSSSKPVRPTKHTPARPKAKRPPLGPIEASYPYCDADGVVVGEFRRHRGKQFRWKKVNDAGELVDGQPKPCPLYLLPDVVAAVREGRTVHLAEGEKDADAVRAAGEVATTIPNGATVQQDGAAKNLTADHLAALRGAHVVIWADRDGPDAKKPERGYQGYRHAMRMVRELADVAASVRVVEALAGKDAYDHLDAGHALSDAVVIDPADRVPADILARWGEAPASAPAGDGEGQGADVYDFPTRPHAGGDARRGGGGGGGDSDGRVREVYVKDEYEVYNGCLVQVKRHAATKHKLAEIVRTEILNAHARMTRQVVRDLGADVDAEPLVDLEVTSPDGESYTLRSLPRKDFEDPSKWTGKVPLPLTFPRGPMKGRLANAIIATSGAIPVETAYGLLGWHEIAPGEWAYLHAAGAIGKDGPLLGTRVEVSPRLRGFKLPPEIPAGDALRRSYDAVMAIAEHLPAHLAYPLIAIGCRAVLGDCATPVMAVGSPGTYKSGSVALIQQMYMPTSRYDRMPAGLGEDSSTGGAAEQLLHEAGHGVLTIDDSAPDRGVARAAARVAALIRAVANRQSKARLERDTSKGLRADKPPRALAVLTGEDQPTVQSAERRVVYLPFRGGDVSIEDLEAASAPWMIEARSGLTAALAQRVAAMMPNADWLAEQRTHWSKWFAAADDRDMTDGLVVSRCNTVADLWIGLRTMLEHVVEAGVVTREEAAQHQHDALAAFRDLLSVQFDLTEGRTLSERFAHLVRSALTSGRAHLQHPDGGKPVHADRFGWQATITDKESKAGGAAIGWTDGETVWMNPGPAYAAAEMEGRAQADALDVTQRALKKHLVQAHPTAFEPAKGHGLPLEQRATLSGVRQRVYALPYSWLYPDDVDDDNGDQCATPPPPPELPFNPTADPSPAGPSSDDPPPLPDASTAAAAGTAATGAAPAANGPQMAAERPAEPPKAARTPEHPRERQKRRYKAAGVVVDVDGAYLVNGSGPVELPDVGSFSELLDWALTLDLGVHHAGDTKARADGVRDDAGLVVVMPKLARKLGAPKRAPDRDKPPAAAKKAVAALTADGWKVGQRGLAPYTQVWKVNGDGRHGRSHFLVFAGWSVDPIFKDLPPAAQVAYRLSLYVDTLGYQLVYSAGATGTTLLRQTRAGTPRPLVDAVTEVPPPATNRDLAPIEDLEWDYWRDLTDDEQVCCDVLVGMDVNASYLNAAASTVVGYGQARHVERPSLDELKGIPGYVVLDPISSPPADALLPDLLDMHASVSDSRHARRDGKPFPVTAPMLAALLEAGERPTVREAWVFDARDEQGQPTSGRHLQTWAHTLRDAIYLLKRDPAAADDPDVAAVLDELKLTYAAGLGRLASERFSKGRSVWLPYWDHATKASAQASIWRKVTKTAAATGRYPVGIARDTIYYAASSAGGELPTGDAAMALLPTGVKGGFIYDGPDAYVIGHVKWSGSATVAAYRDALAVTDVKAQMHAIESIWTTPKMIGRSE